jgi:hypothetical protein
MYPLTPVIKAVRYDVGVARGQISYVGAGCCGFCSSDGVCAGLLLQ